ncbi:hypothetical protein M422DRAFT_783619 [Sphaerobolus stellatus SS14]|uniref:Uncharacterized protein n=1 Tax=Sphaerobolus stellatus (strain SS14) TaxID=990650 RepID=A0A0C9USA7_SPHS4|nr:hypothetical protein M422DRAFT_783619 [Sphaerobolus stellatus SS14]
MALRAYALWGRNKFVFLFLASLIFVHLFVASWGVSETIMIQFPKGLVGCIMSGNGIVYSFFFIMPVITDTAIFILTMYKTNRWDSGRRTPLIELFRRDGIFYYIVIVSVNLANLIIYWTAPPELKSVLSGPAQILTTLFVSRLVLNLRDLPMVTVISTLHEDSGSQYLQHGSASGYVVSTIIGFLGGQIEDESDTHFHGVFDRVDEKLEGSP